MIRSLLGQIWRHWCIYVALALIWAVALFRLLVDPTPRLPILFNVSPSLPFWVVIVSFDASLPRRGDYVVYAFEGTAKDTYRNLRHQPFFKRIGGIPGDVVAVNGRNVYVNGRYAGFAKTRTAAGMPLEPIQPTVIPQEYYYVVGESPDSFDSRYAISGLVSRHHILARVTPLL